MGKVWYFSGYDGDKRGNGRDPWVENEDSARSQALNEAPGIEKLATQTSLRKFKDARGRTIELRQDVSLRLHAQDVTIFGERATFESSEPVIKLGRATGDVGQRFGTEVGATALIRAVK